MAHQIFMQDGRASMFYVGERPWHGLGLELETPPRTAADAIRAANLDWLVEKVPLYAADGIRLIQMDQYALVPRDRWGKGDCPVFGYVRDDYRPLQNIEAFEFFDPLIKAGVASYETGGALGQGERVWVLAAVRGSMDITPTDRIDKYVLLSNSHDGKSSVQLKFTPVRVVCNNTLTLALSKGPAISVPHRAGLKARLALAREQLGLCQYAITPGVRGSDAEFQAEQIRELLTQGFSAIETSFRRMVDRRLTNKEWTDYFATVFPDPEQPDEARARQAARTRDWASFFGKHGKGNDGPPVRGSLWAAYNGVTEFVDHRAPPNAGATWPDKHLRSVWFGQAANDKARAFRVAMELMGRPA